ncbi:DNA-3-methyladenine glycosylase I [Spongiibacter sp. KMU-158]|uniref:DNA-3-methyladenine glycosylase I n=1 Tax=Spongiibacter pelagi TaxID=2760804 RepID=A0A927BYM9_9GAMM|nr:DNA-3-methyladenine glycosylase I [Spongiibacter pelagi]MBD2857983.1 DNA-3-methyladenine glycosylase I [Spongiibacter pelagi]
MAKSQEPCGWCGSDPLYLAYHNDEWGVPCTDDQRLFEFLILESAQAGLSWITILRKREAYRKAFAGFNAKKVAAFDEAKVEALMNNEGIVRNRKKIESAISNAQCFLQLQKEFGEAHRYFWQFFGGKPKQNQWQSLAEVPATTEISDAIAKDMKKRGFRFFGSTICYAHLQALGFVNDHLVNCPQHKAVKALGKNINVK